MKQKITNLKVGLDEELEEKLKLLQSDFSDYRVLKKSLDARGRKAPHFIYSLDLYSAGAKAPKIHFELEQSSLPKNMKKPIIVGSGPAGLFAALRLVERGIPCILLEQGTPTKERLKDIASYWRKGKLNPDNNVCHGEGGAGLFSDGKLITRIKSPHIKYVMNQLVRFGAPEEIEYLSNPHVGSDKIRRVIPVMREYLQNNGCEILFNTKMTSLITEGQQITGLNTLNKKFYSNHIVLACGHSATDLFYKLKEQKVYMEAKPFAIGLRVEHPQNTINKMQYKTYYDHPKLSAANYKLTYNNADKSTGVYSFCMCPGGFVLTSSTEPGTVVSNGMSNYRRNSPYANSAIVVTVQPPDINKTFSGLDYRTQLEKKAYKLVTEAGGNKELPAQYLTDFLNNKQSSSLDKSSSLSGTVGVNLNTLFTENIQIELKNAFEKFNHNMKGFIHEKAQVFGVESRTSCPIRITRDKQSLESLSHNGLYPCGEGAGYAGGITSAACDGINIADKIFEICSKNRPI